MIQLTDSHRTTPGGLPVQFFTRDGTNDANVTISLNVWGDLRSDEYRMTGRKLDGWAIDIGAHIGGWSIPTAMDNPGLRIVAVEPVPENAALLAKNAELNGVADRVIVVQAAAAGPGTSEVICHYGYRNGPDSADDYYYAHRFVAETWGSEGNAEFAEPTEAVSLDTLLERYGIDEVSFLKTDAEGAEWSFLNTAAMSKVRVAVGEYHGVGMARPAERIVEMLSDTHDVELWNTEPVVGLFEATRR